ncbi:hypothetical protein TRFO_28755 [Tritrichomonas foetus]|uniref:Uncharacterized protein n=1 Tax=Tritrichomonas foetus TaxID=1144522 RepID=A0A1J4K333_9EUKA|nr:hypothetical protein TRFO_28755 [Tritrichomonas foetus]|eukprot:OHT03909.1 hypothetical protein TRFO_28755 [Tritrichomonas foetus]
MEALQQLIRQKPELKPYFQEKVYPVLTNALEALLNEIEFRRLRVEDGEELPEIQPILFLAQYLMRNNPGPED